MQGLGASGLGRRYDCAFHTKTLVLPSNLLSEVNGYVS